MNARFVGGPLDGQQRVIQPADRYYVAILEPFRPLFRASPAPDAEPMFKKHEYQCAGVRWSKTNSTDQTYIFEYRGIAC